MGWKLPRFGDTGSVARRPRPAKSVKLRFEQFEDRINPVQFSPQPALTFPAGALNNNGCVATADFNRDGRMDAVLTNFGTDYASGAGNSITVLYGRASGGFNRVNLSTAGQNVAFVSVADINGDTFPDLVACNANQQNMGSVSVFRNDGAGNLSLVGSPFSSFGRNTCWVGLADMTGDGVLDVVTCSFGKNNGQDDVTGQGITIFSGNGNFTFNPNPIGPTLPAIQFVPTALAVADFDGDGIRDIAACVPGVPADSTAPQTDGSVYIFKGTGSGGFAAPVETQFEGALPTDIRAADLNADGRLDLVIANAGDPNATPEFRGSTVAVLLNISSVGNPSFGIPNALAANCFGTFAVVVADFNLDGKADIASVNYGGYQTTLTPSTVALYLGNGFGSFTPETPGVYNTYTLAGSGLPGGGQYLAVGDFDANGTPDLIVAHAANVVTLVMNTAPPPTLRPTVSSTRIGDGTAQRSKVTSLTVTFNTQVTFVGPISAAFSLTRLGDNAALNFSATANVVGGATVVTLDNFTGSAAQSLSLADGGYRVTAVANLISANGQTLDGNGDGVSGDNYTLADSGAAGGLFRFYGDVTGDRFVNGADFATFRTAFGSNSTSSAYVAALDFNGDGVINGTDFAEFRTRFGATLP